jgi:hypothetical protein
VLAWQLNSVPPLAAATMKNVDSALEIYALDPSGASATPSIAYGEPRQDVAQPGVI